MEINQDTEVTLLQVNIRSWLRQSAHISKPTPLRYTLLST